MRKKSASLCLTVGVFLLCPLIPACNDGDARKSGDASGQQRTAGAGKTAIPETTGFLSEVRNLLQNGLDEMDAELEGAAKKLSELGLAGEQVRAVLLETSKKNPEIVEVATVSLEGRIVTIAPDTYKDAEGMDISWQEHVNRGLLTGKPVLSKTIRLVEGYSAVVLQRPILSARGKAVGFVSAIFRPASLVERTVAPKVRGFPIEVWLMETNGRILYDPDIEEIGRDLFTDPLYKPYESLQAAGREIAEKPFGKTSYEFLGKDMKKKVVKEAFWTTVGLHGTEWRLVISRALPHDGRLGPGAALLLPEDDEPRADNELKKLSQNATFQDAARASDKQKIEAFFRAFYDDNPGVCSIQFLDAGGIFRTGYPPECAIQDFDLTKSDFPESKKILSAVASKQETKIEIRLFDGRLGLMQLQPIFSEGSFSGTAIAVRVKP